MATDDFLRAHLDQMIDLRHFFVVLAERLPRSQMEAGLVSAFERKNRQGQVVKISVAIRIISPPRKFTSTVRFFNIWKIK